MAKSRSTCKARMRNVRPWAVIPTTPTSGNVVKAPSNVAPTTRTGRASSVRILEAAKRFCVSEASGRKVYCDSWVSWNSTAHKGIDTYWYCSWPSTFLLFQKRTVAFTGENLAMCRVLRYLSASNCWKSNRLYIYALVNQALYKNDVYWLNSYVWDVE